MNEWSSSYNARNIKPADIARLFIQPPAFGDILRFGNSVLVGPRGSGKTTILKLITPSGLHEWLKRDDVGPTNIDYVPLYIPADTLWKGEANSIADDSFSEVEAAKIQNGLFVDYTLYEIVKAIQDSARIAQYYDNNTRPYWCISISRDCEAVLSSRLSDFWQVDKVQNSLLGLKLALLGRQNMYYSVVNSVKDDQRVCLETLPDLSLLAMVRGFFDIMEELFDKNRWSINFDEMEIAPAYLLRSLYENLRSFDQRAALKFSLFPFMDFMNIKKSADQTKNAPVEGQDFHTFILGGKFRKEKYEFSKKLMKNICRINQVPWLEFVDYMNKSDELREGRSVRGRGLIRNYEAIFKSLSQKDPTFRSHLSKNEIAIKGISKLDEKQKAAKVRKIAPLADFRDRHLRDRRASGQSQAAQRSRKGYAYYHGFEQLLRLTESNPRAIHFYVNDLIGFMRRGVQSQAAQNAVIPSNVDRFRAMVATQIVPAETLRRSIKNPLEVVDLLGKHLSNALLKRRFVSEPVLSYEIGERMDGASLEMIGIAVNTGALIVDAGPSQKFLVLDLRGMRIRVSHQIAPYFPLPTLTGQMVTIAKLPAAPAEQADLLSWSDG